jgi:hypothetical protein
MNDCEMHSLYKIMRSIKMFFDESLIIAIARQWTVSYLATYFPDIHFNVNLLFTPRSRIVSTGLIP